MKINELIEKYYSEFQRLCKNNDTVISFSKTSEDILNDVIFRTLKKYKSCDDINEEEVYNYIRKTLLTELKYQFPRKKNDPLIFTDNILLYDGEDC